MFLIMALYVNYLNICTVKVIKVIRLFLNIITSTDMIRYNDVSDIFVIIDISVLMEITKGH